MLIGVIAEETLLPLSVEPDMLWDGNRAANWNAGDNFYIQHVIIIGFVMPSLVDEGGTIIQGPAPAGVTIQGTVASSGDLPIGLTSTDAGSGWIALDTGHLWVWNGTGWGDAGQIQFRSGVVEVFGHTYITQDYQGIWPDLYDDTMPEVFYDFFHDFIPVLRPDWFPEGDQIPLPVMDDTTQAVLPRGAYIDPEIFYSPAFRGDIQPPLFVDGDVIRPQVIRRAGDPIVLLTGEPFNDADLFYTPAFSSALSPSGVVDIDVFYAPFQGTYITSSAFGSDDVIYASHPGPQLLPSSVVDIDIFFGPALHTPGRMDLFTDLDLFLVPSLNFAALQAPLVTEADAFYTPIFAGSPPLVPFDPIVDHEDTFYAPAVSADIALTPFLYAEGDTFILGRIDRAAQALTPALFVDSDAIFAPLAERGFTSASFTDTDLFYVPAFKYDQTLAPNIWGDADPVYAPTVVSGIQRQQYISASRSGLASAIVTVSSNDTNVQVVSNIGALGPAAIGAAVSWTYLVSGSRAGASSPILPAGDGKVRMISNVGTVT